MSALGMLIRVELSRYRYLMLAGKGSKPTIIAAALLCLIGVFVYMMAKPSDASLLFFTVIPFFTEVLFGFAFFHLMSIAYNDQREWWLTYPHPRKTLVWAKFWSLCILGIVGLMYTQLIALGTLVIAQASHWIVSFSFWELIRVIVANTLFGLIAIPFVVGLGIATLALQMGWLKLLNVFLIFIVFDGVFAGWLYIIHRIQDKHEYWIVSPWYILLYTAILLLVGWTISYLCILFAAKRLNRLGELRNRSHDTWAIRHSQNNQGSQIQPLFAGVKRPFWALVAFEYTRFRWIGKHASWVIRTIISIIILGLGVGGYFAAGSLDGLINMPHFVLEMAYIGIVIYSMSSLTYEFTRGRGEWWLGYPQSRLVLLSSRLIGQVSAMMFYMLLALIATGIGFSIRLLTQPSLLGYLKLATEYWSLSFLLVFTLIVLNVLLLQATPVLHGPYKGLQILIVPLSLSYFLGMQFINRWVIPKDHYEQGPLMSFWGKWELLLGIGLPLGIICFILGVRFLNQYTNAIRQNQFLAGRNWMNHR